MFLINRVKLEGTKDSNLLEILEKWFNIAPNQYNSNANLLELYTKRSNNFDIEKISCLDPDINFYQNPVQEIKRLCVANIS